MEVKEASPSAATVLIVVAFFLITLTNASAGTEKVLANFPGAHGGLQPWAGLVSDGAGNFYGVTYYGGPHGKGEVFRVHYSAATGWSECTAYAFKGGKDGANPYGGLIFDRAGNLYGSTSAGGFYGEGTVFKLTHTSGCNWTSTVLHQFGNVEDGNYPAAALIFDKSGSLYGTTQAGGAAPTDMEPSSSCNSHRGSGPSMCCTTSAPATTVPVPTGRCYSIKTEISGERPSQAATMQPVLYSSCPPVAGRATGHNR